MGRTTRLAGRARRLPGAARDTDRCVDVRGPSRRVAVVAIAASHDLPGRGARHLVGRWRARLASGAAVDCDRARDRVRPRGDSFAVAQTEERQAPGGSSCPTAWLLAATARGAS